MESALRNLPAMHRLLEEPRFAPFRVQLGPATIKAVVTDVLDAVRRDLAFEPAQAPSYETLVVRIIHRLTNERSASLIGVINGTGILLHTNLGRAPLAESAQAAAAAVAGGYSNLEFDLESGTRGSRYDRVGGLLRETTGAQDGLLVNNCAAAVLLVLDTFAKGREVIVSRNQLIEIGGGFRLPEVLARSGATLVEVGTTNKVYLRDFERALSVDTALILRSHPSNFRIDGFVADVTPHELAELGRRAGVPTLEDLGTGAVVDVRRYGLPRERTVGEAVADGIDLVAFSGDKLLGGPQAGVIVGKAAPIARLRTNPLLRALRVDKATLAAFAATLQLYTEPGALERIPLYGMLAIPIEALTARADRLRSQIGAAAGRVEVVRTSAFVGGGSLPQAALPSAGISLRPPGGHLDELASRLRRRLPPILGRIGDGGFIIDLRTVDPAHDRYVADALARELHG